MATGADANSDDLRKLARELDRATGDIKTALSRLDSVLRSAHWNDSTRRQFENDFSAVTAAARQFGDKTGPLKQYLDRKARELDQYLSR
jgi:uncharacterized protein YukE